MKFGLYPTVGVSLPFLLKLERCCGAKNGCPSDVQPAPLACGASVQVCAACGVPDDCPTNAPRGSCVSRADIKAALEPEYKKYCADCCGPDSSLALLNARLAFLTAKVTNTGRALTLAELAVDVAKKSHAQHVASEAVKANAIAKALKAKYVDGTAEDAPTAPANSNDPNPLAAAKAATADDIRQAIKLVLDHVRAKRNKEYAAAFAALSVDGGAQDNVYEEEKDYVEARIATLNGTGPAADSWLSDLTTAQAALKAAVKALKDTRDAPLDMGVADLAAFPSLSDAALVLKHQQETYATSIA